MKYQAVETLNNKQVDNCHLKLSGAREDSYKAQVSSFRIVDDLEVSFWRARG